MSRLKTTSLIDDLDGNTLDIDDAHTVTWAWRGVTYETDVSTDNLQKIESGKVPLAKLLTVSTRTGGRQQPSAPRLAVAPPTKSTSNSEAAKVREWASRNGYDVAPKGRIAREVVDAYRAARSSKPTSS